MARILDIVGEHLTFLILRDLLCKGPREFQDPEANSAGIGPSTVLVRLKRPEQAGTEVQNGMPSAMRACPGTGRSSFASAFIFRDDPSRDSEQILR